MRSVYLMHVKFESLQNILFMLSYHLYIWSHTYVHGNLQAFGWPSIDARYYIDIRIQTPPSQQIFVVGHNLVHLYVNIFQHYLVVNVFQYNIMMVNLRIYQQSGKSHLKICREVQLWLQPWHQYKEQKSKCIFVN